MLKFHLPNVRRHDDVVFHVRAYKIHLQYRGLSVLIFDLHLFSSSVYLTFETRYAFQRRAFYVTPHTKSKWRKLLFVAYGRYYSIRFCSQVSLLPLWPVSLVWTLKSKFLGSPKSYLLTLDVLTCCAWRTEPVVWAVAGGGWNTGPKYIACLPCGPLDPS